MGGKNNKEKLNYPLMIASQSKSSPERLLLKGSILIGIISFISAFIIGIWRIALFRGFELPPIPESLPPHGNLIVGGFLGTLIIFERMLALPTKWLIWVPYTWGISAILIHIDSMLFKILNIASLFGWGVSRLIAYKTYKRLWNPLIEFLSYVALSTALLAKGGLAGSVQSALAGLSFPIAVIGIERIELMLSFTKIRMTTKIVYISLIVYLIISIINSLFYLIPLQAVGIILLFVCVGLIFNDFAVIAPLKSSKAVQISSFGSRMMQAPLYRFSRKALAFAYFWLIISSISLILWNQIQPMAKDIVFHSIGLGFIFTMILAHAPLVIGSAIAKFPKQAPSATLFYLFQIGTIGRIIGDLLFNISYDLWAWSGWLTGIIHLISFILYILSVLKSFRD